jgi:hypothetical protein
MSSPFAFTRAVILILLILIEPRLKRIHLSPPPIQALEITSRHEPDDSLHDHAEPSGRVVDSGATSGGGGGRTVYAIGRAAGTSTAQGQSAAPN